VVTRHPNRTIKIRARSTNRNVVKLD